METNNRDAKDILFFNEFPPTKKVVKEALNILALRKLTFFCYAFSVIIVLLGWLYNFRYIAMVVAWLVLIFWLSGKYSIISKAYQTLVAEKDKGDTQRIFYDDTFDLGDKAYSYDEVLEVVSAKLCLYIFIDKKIAVTVKKDSFTKGNYEPFVAFLREKLKDNPKALRGLK